jgi:phosphoketolase
VLPVLTVTTVRDRSECFVLLTNFVYVHLNRIIISRERDLLAIIGPAHGGPALASLNIFLTSHVWRQDHNGFSHQDPSLLRERTMTISTCAATRRRALRLGLAGQP